MARAGTTFSIDIGVQAAGVDTAAESMAALGTRLTDVGSSSTKTVDAVKAAETEISKFSKTVEASNDNAKESGVNLRALHRSLGELGGPLGAAGAKVTGLGHAWETLQEQLGSEAGFAVAALGIAALVAGVIALGVEVGKSIVQFTVWAVKLADTADTNLRLAQGIARSVAGGTKLNASIDALTKKVPLSREELTQMADKLAKTGLRGDALSTALDKVAIKAATLKFGPDFAKKMLSLDNQSKTLQANIAGLFSGLHIEALEEAFSKVVELFDSTTVTGKGIKVVFESLFQPLIDGATAFVPKLIGAFIQLEIWIFKFLIFIKPFESKILLVGKAFAILAAVILGVVVLAFAALFAFMVAFTAPIAAAVFLIYELIKALWGVATSIYDGAGQALNFFSDLFASVRNFLSSFSLADIGAKLIQGLVDGIKNAGAAVVSSVENVVGDAVTAAKKKLGIASPSKIGVEIGENFGGAVAGGLDNTSGAVQSAMASVVSPPTALESVGDVKAGAQKNPPAPKSGDAANLSGAIFNFYGVQGAEDAEARFREMLVRAMEGGVAQLGAGAPATVTP